jgi:peptide chain release factor 1
MQEELARIEAKIVETQELLKDPAMGRMAIEELVELKRQKQAIEEAMASSAKATAAETEEQNFNSIIIEARQGVGGDEAKIWAEDLLRMYTRFANLKNWKVELLDEGTVQVKGKGIYQELKWETGVHRVQRVPDTEAAGRIHTSTASIVVLPEVPESVVEIKEDDLLWEFQRGGGHGGQNVNKVATAVRLTHKPTGLVAQCRQERTQEQNRKIALSLLRAMLWEKEQEAKASLLAGQRAAIGTSSRSEKIRTYNYPQNRVTDHRINKSWHNLDKIMEGDLEDVIAAMKTSPAVSDGSPSPDSGEGKAEV